MTTKQDICCVENCNKKATNYLGNNLLKGRIPFCKDCIVLYEKHLMARERLFIEDGRAEMLKRILEILDKADYGSYMLGKAVFNQKMFIEFEIKPQLEKTQ